MPTQRPIFGQTRGLATPVISPMAVLPRKVGPADDDASSVYSSHSRSADSVSLSERSTCVSTPQTLSSPPSQSSLAKTYAVVDIDALRKSLRKSEMYISTTEKEIFDDDKCSQTAPSECDTVTNGQWRRGAGFWRCFIAVCVPILLSAFEGSVVSTALPTISRELGLGPSVSWVATAFLLASIICQPLYGQLADIWGRRHLMMVAVVVFCAGSIVAALANNGAVLIFGRIVQGLGSGGIDLFAELIICDIIPLQRRGHYVAIKAAVYAVGTTVGPILGGVFAETEWRWCFGINVPVCALALVMMWQWLQVNSGKCWELSVMQQLARVDVVGISLLTISVVLMLFAFSTGGGASPWTDTRVLTSIVLGCLGVVAFALWENSRWCQHPIMAPHVFSNRTTIAGFAVTMIHGFITYGYQFYLPPFFQAILGATPTESGVFILPCTLTIVVLSAVGGPLLAHYGRYRLMHKIGFGLMALGLAGFTFVGTGRATAIVWSLVVGVGSGLIVSTTLPTVLVELTDKENAAATGSWAFLRGLGSLLGVAIPGAAFNGMFSHELHGLRNKKAAHMLDGGKAYEYASSLSNFDHATKKVLIGDFKQGMMVMWVIFLGLAVIGFVVAFVERQIGLRADLDSEYGLKEKAKSASQETIAVNV